MGSYDPFFIVFLYIYQLWYALYPHTPGDSIPGIKTGYIHVGNYLIKNIENCV
jgi:hypothetical protein